MVERGIRKIRAHVWIEGRVQGVFFRGSAWRMAQNLGITGWIKNRWDGKVEAIFEGEEKAVKKMVDWSRKGPPAAIVEDIQIKWEEWTGSFDSFSAH